MPTFYELRRINPNRVGFCVERSQEMVVGLRGILKAGGAYVPLDPAIPKSVSPSSSKIAASHSFSPNPTSWRTSPRSGE